MYGGHRMSRCEYLGALIMESNKQSRIFVPTPQQSSPSAEQIVASAATQQKKLKLRRVGWLFILGLSELIGTSLLVFIGCTGSAPGIHKVPLNGVEISVLYAFTVFIIVQIFFHISGGYINPVITLAAYLLKILSLQAACMYVFAELAGAILGYGLMLVLVPKEALYDKGTSMNKTHGHCAVTPDKRVSIWQAFLGEYLATAVLIFICCSIWDKRNETKLGSAPLKIGLTILVLGIGLGGISGCGINPARVLAAAVGTGVWTNHWIYWIAPAIATVITCYFYKFIFEYFNDPDKNPS